MNLIDLETEIIFQDMLCFKASWLFYRTFYFILFALCPLRFLLFFDCYYLDLPSFLLAVLGRTSHFGLYQNK
jgi:hypothetical protein